ncbi:hypothetical protein [Nocardioides pyridinolyticus]
MSASYQQVFSSRATESGVEVVGTFLLTGDGVSLSAVEDAFTSPLKLLAQEIGADAAVGIAADHERREETMRTAITDALEKVAPEQRAELMERYGLAVGDVG